MTAEERAAIMMLKAENCSARQIALTLHRAPSTITRELARFASWRDGPAAVACVPAQYDVRAAGPRARRARFKHNPYDGHTLHKQLEQATSPMQDCAAKSLRRRL